MKAEEGAVCRQYLFERPEASLQRWHAEPTLKNESLAEHQFFVAKNTLFICRMLKHYEIDYNIEDFHQDIAVEIALQHDSLELITGDVSGPAKRQYPELKEVLTSIEEQANKEGYFQFPESIGDHYRWIGNWGLDKDRIETQIVKYADVIAAAAFIESEIKFGNLYMEEHNRRIKTWFESLDWPWLQELRKNIYLP